MKPRLLDLFCGAGGAARGYQEAGFRVVGVDIKPQASYCGDEFAQLDALMVLRRLIAGERVSGGCERPRVRRIWEIPWDLSDFSAIHASPPCQAYTALNVMWNAKEHPELIAPTRELLIATELPYVIENVVGAPLKNPVTICGAALGLGTDSHQLARHRLFETNFPLMVPPCAHGQQPTLGVYGDHARDRRRSTSIGNGQFTASLGLEMAREAMGIDWMNWREISQAIPPAYTKHIGEYLMAHLQASAEYRVVATVAEGESSRTYEEGPILSLREAEKFAKDAHSFGDTNVHIQQRTISETPWTDVEEEG